ncbi:hypothetical protein [Pseudomonas aegrilactucae]|uniref:Uncharacterized protein n=1 Tax=Pseudomonas aegrilactucae TaxID=2854028 RepID=A0A9Q2XM90_9PSED|nr:hypothetical protein [Pseudomonas aegrilactucae]MBV6289273.1 hypothetical protein [Pseudomonas aegrilactucae]
MSVNNIHALTTKARADTNVWFIRSRLSPAHKRLVRLSQFQALGWFFTVVDCMAKYSRVDQLNAMYAFNTEVDQFNFGSFSALHLLASATWSDRVVAAWCLVGVEQRAIARQFVADEAHNFWSDTQFCNPGWDEYVQARVTAINAGETGPAQFDIVSFVGQPARARLVFAQ